MTLVKYTFAELLGIKVCYFRLPQAILGHLLAAEKTKFSSFRRAGAQSDGPQLLLWGQVQLYRLPKQLTTIYHKDSRFTTAYLAGKFSSGRLKALDKSFCVCVWFFFFSLVRLGFSVAKLN